ncbi:MAG: hypothetical protein ACRC1H_03935, partial [Caldilineaceae bacterium]
LRWMGNDLGIPGPFVWVSRLPFFSGNRYPSRYSVMLLLCVALLAAAGIVALVGWLQRRGVRRAPIWAGSTVAALLLLEPLSLPLPMSDMRVPSIYQRLAGESGDLAVLELPTGWRNGARVLGYSDLLIMRQQWWQTTSGKRRMGGNTSRNPDHKFQFYTEHPLVGDLIALMNAERPHLEPVIDEQLDAMIAHHTPQSGQELAELGVGWVTVHVEHASPALLRFVDEALPLALIEEWQGVDPEGEPATIRLYRVLNEAEVDASEAQHEVDAAPPSGMAFLAEGWSPLSEGDRRLANRPVSHLLLPLPERGGHLAIESATMPTRVRMNGQLLAGDWDGKWITVPFGAGRADQPVDRVTIEWATDGVPAPELATVASPIGDTGATLPAGVSLAVRSAGEEVGDFAQL